MTHMPEQQNQHHHFHHNYQTTSLDKIANNISNMKTDSLRIAHTDKEQMFWWWCLKMNEWLDNLFIDLVTGSRIRLFISGSSRVCLKAELKIDELGNVDYDDTHKHTHTHRYHLNF